VDDDGQVHRTGTMRLATARDELEPLRDPRVTGPDDPRLTVLVLARVISTLGSLPQVTMHEIEGLFAVDLAYLQDFYGVINFGNQAEFDALVQAQQGTQLVVDQPPAPPSQPPAAEPVSAASTEQASAGEVAVEPRPTLRHAVEELPRKNG
jgi:hypothetical protein